DFTTGSRIDDCTDRLQDIICLGVVNDEDFGRYWLGGQTVLADDLDDITIFNKGIADRRKHHVVNLAPRDFAKLQGGSTLEGIRNHQVQFEKIGHVAKNGADLF